MRHGEVAIRFLLASRRGAGEVPNRFDGDQDRGPTQHFLVKLAPRWGVAGSGSGKHNEESKKQGVSHKRQSLRCG